MFNKYMAVGIKINDFDKAFDFYTNILGLSVKTVDKENKFAEVKLGELVIALLTKETLEGMCGYENFSTSEKPSNIFAVEVSDVKIATEQLKAKGVEFIQEPKTTPWGQKVAYFRDIEGYIWEISEKFED